MDLNILQYCLPEILIATMACFILLVDVFIAKELRIVSYILSQFTLIGAAVLTVKLLIPLTAQQQAITIFDGAFIVDNLSNALKLCLYFLMFVIFVCSRVYNKQRFMFTGEYFVLCLFSLLGMMVLVSSGNFLTLYLGLELLSLPIYALVAMAKQQYIASEAAMKYFIMGSVASGLLLFGVSLLYGATTSIEFSTIATFITAHANTNASHLLLVGTIFVIAGLAFKFGVVPFHMWVPDVYEGAPTSMAMMIGTMPKIAALGMALRLFMETFAGFFAEWQMLLWGMAVLSLAVGNTLAIAQSNIKRMLAYSSIAHMGFLLLGLVAGPTVGYVPAMFYIMIYAIVMVGIFGVIIILSKQNMESDYLEDFRGLGVRHPWLAFVAMILLFTLAGVPPTAGFYAKFMILQGVVGAGYLWLAVWAVVFSVVGAFYYLRVIRYMYFEPPQAIEQACNEGMALSGWALVSCHGLAALLLGVFPALLLDLCVRALY